MGRSSPADSFLYGPPIAQIPSLTRGIVRILEFHPDLIKAMVEVSPRGIRLTCSARSRTTRAQRVTVDERFDWGDGSTATRHPSSASHPQIARRAPILSSI